MKNLTTVLTITVLIAVITSCSNVLDNRIDPDYIESDIKTIKAENPDLDSTKSEILDNLYSLSKGREAYIDERLKGVEGIESIEKYIVDKDKFKEVTDNLFNYFKANEITYKDFLSEIDSLDALDAKYDDQLESVYVEIDEICIEKQKEMDGVDAKAETVRKQLNEMVDLEVISIRETKDSYRDVVEVKIKMINKTDKPIEAISFNITLKDKLGDQVAKLGCKSNNRFTTSRVASYIYDEYEHRDIYKSLKNTSISHVTVKNEINKINLGGELISVYGDDLESLLSVNYDYTTPDDLIGYCPYLDDEHELMNKIENAREEKKQEIEKKFLVFKKYQEQTNKLLDFSNILG